VESPPPLVVERLDNTVQTLEEIERDFKVRRLAIVPDLDGLKKLYGTELTATETIAVSPTQGSKYS
jgi:hypothetical protein